MPGPAVRKEGCLGPCQRELNGGSWGSHSGPSWFLQRSRCHLHRVLPLTDDFGIIVSSLKQICGGFIAGTSVCAHSEKRSPFPCASCSEASCRLCASVWPLHSLVEILAFWPCRVNTKGAPSFASHCDRTSFFFDN